jgi:predicted nucleic acid-binding protein
MAVLVDTNILLRSVQPHHPHFQFVEHAFAILRARNETLNVTAQNLIEFWAVATRPLSDNGLGMAPEAATNELGVLKLLFFLLPEPASIFEEWERIVTTYRVSGKSTHDARLVAAMKLNDIRTILTFNTAPGREHLTRCLERHWRTRRAPDWSPVLPSKRARDPGLQDPNMNTFATQEVLPGPGRQCAGDLDSGTLNRPAR